MIWFDYLDITCILWASGLAWYKWGPAVAAFVAFCLVVVSRGRR